MDTAFDDDMLKTVASVERAVEAMLSDEGSGHDWHHIARVLKTAAKLALEEKADLKIVMLAALLHDVDDRKVSGDLSSEDALPTVHAILANAGAAQELVEVVCETIKMTGFHKSLKSDRSRSLEAHIVSDADQLDAIGAVGIARTFVYGASRRRPMFEPYDFPMTEFTAEQYVANHGSTINHFFEKLLKLRSMMFTEAGRREAQRRHERMVVYLDAFFEETSAPEEWGRLLDTYRGPFAAGAEEGV